MQSSSNAVSAEGEAGTVAAGLAVPRSEPPEADASETTPSEPPAPAELPTASSGTPAKPAASSRPQPPAIPAFLTRGSRPPASTPAAKPERRDADLDLSLGAPLLPERADDPHYYPGISDEPPVPTPLAPPRVAWRVPSLADLSRLGNAQRAAVAGGALLLLGLALRGLFGGAPSSGALVVDVTPADAHVTLDGEPFPEASGLRKRSGLMNGEHVLAADKRGFVSQKREFTFDARGGDLRIMLSLPAEPAPVSQPMAAAPAPVSETVTPPPTTAAPVATASAGVDPGERASARQRRLERIRARREARAARRAESAAAGSSAPAAASATRAAKSGAPALLKLNSVPWAEVYVDKRHVGHTPLMGLQLPPGKHVIRLTNPTLGSSKTLRLKLSAGETVTQVVKL